MWTWLGVSVVVGVASAAQVVSGFGFALIAAPLVALLVGPRPAVVGITLVGQVLVGQLSLRSTGHVDRGAVLAVSGAAFAGMPLGVVVLARADERTLTAAIAVVVLAFTVLLWRGFRLPRSRVTDVVAGFCAGTLSTSTGTSGPPVAIALTNRSMDPGGFRRTISVIFLVMGAAALVTFALGGQVTMDAFAVALAGLPGLVLGSVVGERGFRRLDASTFRAVVLGMLFASGAAALVGAMLS